MDGEGPKGNKVRVFGRRVSLLRQLEAGSDYGPYSPALQGQAGAGLYLKNRQGQRSDWDVSITVVCQYRPATSGPAYPAERAMRPLCAVYGQPDSHRAEQAGAEKAPLHCGGMAERTRPAAKGRLADFQNGGQGAEEAAGASAKRVRAAKGEDAGRHMAHRSMSSLILFRPLLKLVSHLL